jgi:HD superfamily phosphohydrolase
MEIRDPVLGPIAVLDEERPVLDHPLFQRLRRIKQLGFSEYAFPGATHTRYLHSLGVMHLADRVAEAVFREGDALPPPDFERFRRLLRLAGLLHDAGHFPLSHAMEAVMPPRAALNIPGLPDDGRRACHEDYTLLVLLASELTGVIERQFAPWDVTAADVAAVLNLDLPHAAGRFTVGGRDFRRLLHQVVSSELDADRMDYLIRDSHYCGVSYGYFDRDWLINSLTLVEAGDGVHLALDGRAVFTFDHFLLARYHMFLTVYFHHRSVVLERMLALYMQALGASVALPTVADALQGVDDLWLRSLLLAHPGPFRERILAGRGMRLQLEVSGEDAPARRDEMLASLRGRGVEPVALESRGVLSPFFRNPNPAGLYVRRPEAAGGPIRLEEATDLFRRYTQPVSILRVYGDAAASGSETPGTAEKS